MRCISLSLIAFLHAVAMGAPIGSPVRRSAVNPCFVVGNGPLPPYLQQSLDDLARKITCDQSHKTIGNVPDVSTSELSFSSIFFAFDPTTALQFAVQTFTPPEPSSIGVLTTWEQSLDLFKATEIGIRTENGNADTVYVVRLFLELQVARLKKQLGLSEDLGRSTEEVVHELTAEVVRSTSAEDRRLLNDVLVLQAY